MKYSKIAILTFSLLSCIAITSCQDLLTENPKSFLTPENFPTTEKDAIAATNAVYSRLFSSPRELYFAFVPSDEAFQGYHNKRPLTYFAGLNGLDEDTNSLWQEAYAGISRANTVIDYVPLVVMNETTQKRLVGEAKFLRAYYYFGLVRKYGPVPIVSKALTSAADFEGVTRNPVSEVYKLIKQDLLESKMVLPDSYPSAEIGRATKWAAIGTLAKVYLTLEEWGDAIKQCDEIISSGKFNLIADYNKLFLVENEHKLFPNKNGALVNENIWDVQYAVDERPNTITQQTGSRDKTIGGNKAIYGGFENMIPPNTFFTLFEKGDKRLAISYITTVNGRVLQSTTTPGAGPISGKYHNLASGLPIPANSGNNLYVLRYADVLLMRAEAENELIGPSNAYSFINLVRERAGIPALAGLNKESFRIAIRKERATELSFEGHRRYDLLRWGIFVETIKNSTSPFLKDPAAAIQDYHKLLPVPFNEISASNGSIKQNPGYN